jgi:hypothetical protein
MDARIKSGHDDIKDSVMAGLDPAIHETAVSS